MAAAKKLISEHSIARVKESCTTGERSLHAAKAFSKEEVITSFLSAEVLPTASHLTLQKDDDLHITLLPAFLQYVNHSCSPTAFFDTTNMQFIALKEIYLDDELTFFYPSTEWEMAQVFNCHCGNENCLGIVRGASFLTEEILQQYRLTDFILRKLKEQNSQRA